MKKKIVFGLFLLALLLVPLSVDSCVVLDHAFIVRDNVDMAKEKEFITMRLAPIRTFTEYTMMVTAYDLSYQCCKKYPSHPAYGVTASGKKIGTDIFEKDGIFAAPSNFPFGTVMEVEGYGMGKVYDRGSGIKYWPHIGMYGLDIFFHDSEITNAWGVKYLKVKVYD